MFAERTFDHTPPDSLAMRTIRFVVSCNLLLACGLSLSFSGCTESVATLEKAPEFTAADVSADDQLKAKIDRVLAQAQRRHLSATENAAWQALHEALAFGPDAMLVDPDGKVVPVIDYLLGGGAMRGWNLRPGDHGLHAVLEQGSKTGMGHKDQWIGYLAMGGEYYPGRKPILGSESPIQVGSKTYKLGDLLTQAQWECREGMEAGWTLMALHAYLPLDAQWQAEDGTTWSIERLLAMESKADVNAIACGGTHSLSGVTLAVKEYMLQHPEIKPDQLTGGWKAGYEKIRWAIQRAREHQQQDGTFSTNYFQRPGTSADIILRLGTTGHTLEFLALALNDDEIKAPWMAKAAEQLCDLLENTQDARVECGALYHATHGLVAYRMRRFPEKEKTLPAPVPSRSAEPKADPNGDAPPVSGGQ